MVDRCYREAMEAGLEDEEGYEAARRLSLRLKRHGDDAGAEAIWRRMSGNGRSSDIFPLVELAKLYEHRRRELSKAMEFTVAALARLESRHGYSSSFEGMQQREDLRHRMERLARRMRQGVRS